MCFEKFFYYSPVCLTAQAHSRLLFLVFRGEKCRMLSLKQKPVPLRSAFSRPGLRVALLQSANIFSFDLSMRPISPPHTF
jgi:hypothetical protein